MDLQGSGITDDRVMAMQGYLQMLGVGPGDETIDPGNQDAAFNQYNNYLRTQGRETIERDVFDRSFETLLAQTQQDFLRNSVAQRALLELAEQHNEGAEPLTPYQDVALRAGLIANGHSAIDENLDESATTVAQRPPVPGDMQQTLESALQLLDPVTDRIDNATDTSYAQFMYNLNGFLSYEAPVSAEQPVVSVHRSYEIPGRYEDILDRMRSYIDQSPEARQRLGELAGQATVAEPELSQNQIQQLQSGLVIMGANIQVTGELDDQTRAAAARFLEDERNREASVTGPEERTDTAALGDEVILDASLRDQNGALVTGDDVISGNRQILMARFQPEHDGHPDATIDTRTGQVHIPGQDEVTTVADAGDTVQNDTVVTNTLT